MASSIDETLPVAGNPTTASVRANFLTAKNEITDLQAGVSSITATVAAITLSSLISIPQITRTMSASGAAEGSDRVVLLDCTSNDLGVTLFNAAAVGGVGIRYMRIDTNISNQCVIYPFTGQTVAWTSCVTMVARLAAPGGAAECLWLIPDGIDNWLPFK